METLLDDYGARPLQLVFLSDGAPWLCHWISDAFEGQFPSLIFTTPPNRKAAKPPG